MKIKVNESKNPRWLSSYLIYDLLDGVDIRPIFVTDNTNWKMQINKELLYAALIKRGVNCSFENNEVYLDIDDKEVTFLALKNSC